MLPASGQAVRLVAASKAVGYAVGPDHQYWFVLSDSDAIARIDASGNVSSAISCPNKSKPITITGNQGHALIYLSKPREFILFSGDMRLTVKPQGVVMSMAYDPAENLIWYGDDEKLSSIHGDGTPGPSMAIPGGAPANLAFDPSNRRLWFYDPARAKLGFAEGGRIVRDFYIPDPTPFASITVGPGGHAWMPVNDDRQIARCDGRTLLTYKITGNEGASISDIAFPSPNQIACLDRWNAALGVGAIP